MPLYDYQCRSCRQVTEVRHGFKESYDQACAACGGEMARVYSPVGIAFKGSGFYINDSRSNSGASAPKADAATPPPAAPAGDAGSKSESPAATPAPAAGKSDTAA